MTIHFYDQRERKYQKITECLLVGVVSLSIFFVIFTENLREERIAKNGRCLNPRFENRSVGPIQMTQRLWEYFFMPRVDKEFVMSPVLLYQVMEKLAFFSDGFTRSQLQEALSLPCHPLDDQLNHYESNSKIFIKEGRELAEEFQTIWNLESGNIFYEQRKFDQFFPDSNNFQISFPSTLSLLFQGENHETQTAIGTSMTWPIHDAPTNMTSSLNMTDLYVLAHILESDDPESCYQMITIPMIPSGFSLVIFRPKFFCTYEKLIHELGKLDLVTLLHHENGPKAGKSIKISFDPFVLSSSLNLNIPLQALAVVDMYKREEAQFTNIFKCETATQQLSLRDVIHEAEIQLNKKSFHFRHLTPEADGEAETKPICGKYLFFVMDDLKWIPLLFGERFAKEC